MKMIGNRNYKCRKYYPPMITAKNTLLVYYPKNKYLIDPEDD